MTDAPVNKRDIKRLADAYRIKYTEALRMLVAVPRRNHHEFVLNAEALVPRTGTRSRSWSEQVADAFAESLLHQSSQDVLTPPVGFLPHVEDVTYVSARVELAEESFVEEYAGGDELYNVTVVLEVGLEGVVPLQPGTSLLEVSPVKRRVQVELAGLLNRANSNSWELQEQLGYHWDATA